ncbi:Ephrin Type-B Receptor 4 [Manis pentadactyla]|nr:Ephrin Type-B Receptor 4 [Manis pentadactyla]
MTFMNMALTAQLLERREDTVTPYSQDVIVQLCSSSFMLGLLNKTYRKILKDMTIFEIFFRSSLQSESIQLMRLWDGGWTEAERKSLLNQASITGISSGNLTGEDYLSLSSLPASSKKEPEFEEQPITPFANHVLWEPIYKPNDHSYFSLHRSRTVHIKMDLEDFIRVLTEASLQNLGLCHAVLQNFHKG